MGVRALILTWLSDSWRGQHARLQQTKRHSCHRWRSCSWSCRCWSVGIFFTVSLGFLSFLPSLTSCFLFLSEELWLFTFFVYNPFVLLHEHGIQFTSLKINRAEKTKSSSVIFFLKFKNVKLKRIDFAYFFFSLKGFFGRNANDSDCWLNKKNIDMVSFYQRETEESRCKKHRYKYIITDVVRKQKGSTKNAHVSVLTILIILIVWGLHSLSLKVIGLLNLLSSVNTHC